jgi:hypothetical protein
MSHPAVVQSACPRCRKPLRIPAEWLTRPVKCKACGQAVQARVKPRPAPAAAPLPTLPAASVDPFGRPLPPTDLPPLPGTALDAPGSGSLAFDDNPNGTIQVPGRYRRRKGSWVAPIAVMLVALLMTGGAVYGLYVAKPELFRRGPLAVVAEPEKPATATPAVAHPPKPTAGDPEVPAVGAVFPRRLLVVSVNNYLYANPLNYGGDPPDDPRPVRHAVHQFAETFAGHLNVPRDQTFVLSDGGPNARPPLKPVIEKTITGFLDSSRAQDRIVLVFAGHAVEIDGTPYLVPLEGELAAADSLIPLAWLYEKLAACKAQQKILVMDVCRYDPGRGAERPGSGPMGEKLDAALANPPAGVQVWSSCSKGQYAYEYDYADGRIESKKLDVTVKGSVFLNLVFYATLLGNKAGIARPNEPIKLEAYAAPVNDFTSRFAKVHEKADQTPRISGKEPDTRVAFEPSEPPPAKVVVPTPESLMPQGVADRAAIRQLLSEIEVPPVRAARKADTAVPLENVLPFSAETMKPYFAGTMTTAEINAVAAKFPVRAAVLKANKLLHELRTTENNAMPEELRGTATDGVKKDFADLQRKLARVQLLLKEMIEELEGDVEIDSEKSPRWKAHYTYMLAQLKARYAFTYEYNFMFAKIRKDELPALDPAANHKGWRLSSRSELSSTGEAKELANESRKLLEKIAKDHAGTPWAVLARRDRMTALGLKWQPSNFNE